MITRIVDFVFEQPLHRILLVVVFAGLAVFAASDLVVRCGS